MKNFLMFIKFALFSASAGIIQFGSDTLLREVIGLPAWLSFLIALVLSVLWNFTFNRKFTFKSANNVPIAMLKVAAYYVVFTPASTGLDKLLTDKAGWNPFLVTALLMILNFVTEFLYQRFYVFKDSIDSAVKEKDEDTPEKTE